MKKRNYIVIFTIVVIAISLISCTRNNKTEYTKSATVETLDNLSYKNNQESIRLRTKSFDVREITEPDLISEINIQQTKKFEDLEIILNNGIFQKYILNNEVEIPEGFPELKDDEEYVVYEIKYSFEILNPKNIEHIEEKISFTLNSTAKIDLENIKYTKRDNLNLAGEIIFLSSTIEKSEIGDLIFHFDGKNIELDYKF